MKTIADHGEQALDDALNMTFPASDPVAVFVPDAPAEMQPETHSPPASHPRRERHKMSASQDAMDPSWRGRQRTRAGSS